MISFIKIASPFNSIPDNHKITITIGRSCQNISIANMSMSISKSYGSVENNAKLRYGDCRLLRWEIIPQNTGTLRVTYTVGPTALGRQYNDLGIVLARRLKALRDR